MSNCHSTNMALEITKSNNNGDDSIVKIFIQTSYYIESPIYFKNYVATRIAILNY